jgi:Rps23 Pro-64 3,4-dihydroxylase Tpa1-like proline 4-hydroxylase
MTFISAEAVNQPVEHNQPYKWFSFPNILTDEHKKLLFETYPKEQFVENSRFSGEKKNYRFSVLELYKENSLNKKNFEQLSNPWKKFILELSSETYYKMLCAALKVNPDICYVDIALYHYQKGDWVTTHVDNEAKVISQLFYFNLDWHNYWGGQLYLSSSENLTDITQVIAPNEMTSIAIRRTSQAWHGVFPVTQSAKQDRLCLQYEIWSK